ncbi:hypothetical protein [Rhodococcus aerolatus]
MPDAAGFPACRCGAPWHGLPEGGCPGAGAEGPLPERPAAEDLWARLARLRGAAADVWAAPDLEL